jgi:hypothetical protein
MEFESEVLLPEFDIRAAMTWLLSNASPVPAVPQFSRGIVFPLHLYR